jgi:hypothetical protein
MSIGLTAFLERAAMRSTPAFSLVLSGETAEAERLFFKVRFLE